VRRNNLKRTGAGLLRREAGGGRGAACGAFERAAFRVFFGRGPAVLIRAVCGGILRHPLRLLGVRAICSLRGAVCFAG